MRDGGAFDVGAPFDASGFSDGGDIPDAPSPLDAPNPADTGSGEPPLCPLDPLLVACYPFDGDTADHGPLGNHLGSRHIDYDPNGGVLLSESSSLVRTHRPQLDHGVVTLDAWVRLDADPGNDRAMIADHDGVVGLWVMQGELICSLNTNLGTVRVSAVNTIQVGILRHVACTFDGLNVALYVDGRLQRRIVALGLLTTPANPLHVGENAPDGRDQWIGLIDNLRIWNWGRSEADISADFARGR